MRALLLPLMAACAAPAQDIVHQPTWQPVCGDAGDAHTVVINELTWGRIDDDGTALGFDLDGHDSILGDDEGCNKGDLVHPDGTPGIDSAFAGLLPALESTEFQAVEGLIHDSIRNGELLVALETSKVDNLGQDDCVDFRLLQGIGQPILGTDGDLLDDQTIAVDPEIAPVGVSGARIADGELRAHGLEISLALQVLDVFVTFNMHDASLAATLHEDGSATGYFAGGVEVAEIAEAASLDDIDVGDLIVDLVLAAADIRPQGSDTCDQLSITFGFEATPAYVAE